MAVVCTLCARRSEAAETYSLPPRETKGLNLLVSGMVAPEGGRVPLGFLLGGAYEFPTGLGIDLNVGMSFQRLESSGGAVTVVNLIEATAAKQAPTAVFFGVGLGPVIALGNVRPGAKMFGGVEFFHQRAVPIQLGLELIQKFCEEGPWARCPEGEKQTWLAGKVALRF